MDNQKNYARIERAAARRRGVSQAAIYLLLTLWALIVLFPFYWMVLTSVKSYSAYNAEFVPQFFTLSPTLQNYADAFTAVPLARYFTNTLIFTLVTTFLMLAVITLYYAVGHWNGYFHALIYLNKESQFPLQLVLRNLLIINQVSSMAGGAEMMDMAERLKLVEQLKYGIIVVSSLPLMILYPFLQRFFTKGVLVGSIKG